MTMDTEHYSYERFFPKGLLADFVKMLYYFHGRETRTERILPLSLTEITFSLRENGMKSFVIPTGSRYYFVSPNVLGPIIGICFHPWGLNALLGVAPGLLGETKARLEDVMRVRCREMTASLVEKSSPQEMIARLEQYLSGLIRDGGNSVIRDAVRFIDARHGQVKLEELYGRYSLSDRRLQMIFQESTGMTAKKYCRLKRFHYSVAELKGHEGMTAAALSAGYYDQAHFIHEFREFAGTNPGAFLKESNRLNAINAESWW
jgi:AraC-like DNA-binding protein